MTFRPILLATLAAVAARAVPAAAATMYTATLIPTLGGVSTYATGINASGAIVGWSYTSGSTIAHAFVFAGAAPTDLGTLGGVQSFGLAINDAGQVAGASTPPYSNVQHAFLVSDGVMADVHPATAASSVGSAVDNAGDVAGAYTDSNGRSRAYTHAAGVFFDLGTLGGDEASATAMNSDFQVVGQSTRADGSRHAFRANIVDMLDLGTLGGRDSVAFGVNIGGDVVGRSTLPGEGGPHAFVYANGAMSDLGALDGGTSSALAINAAGHVVGTATTAGAASRAFIRVDAAMRDLNTLVVSGLNGATLTDGVAINDAGQIAAQACAASICRSYRLDPVAAAAVQAIEFYYPAFDHYFITAIPDEIAKLDNGAFPGWVRTGQHFAVQAGPQAGTSPVCRFFSASFAPKSSHFYTPDTLECAIVKRDAHWQFEGIVFYVATAAFDGTCAAGTQPVYRLYNDGRGGAPNHRYTTSSDVRAQMIVAGWIPEGQGPMGVAMCALS